MKRMSLAALFYAAAFAIGTSGYSGAFTRGNERFNAHNAPKQKQGKRECARRMRQIAKGTHGY